MYVPEGTRRSQDRAAAPPEPPPAEGGGEGEAPHTGAGANVTSGTGRFSKTVRTLYMPCRVGCTYLEQCLWAHHNISSSLGSSF